jgi:predicted O-methyltransferase YrrM
VAILHEHVDGYLRSLRPERDGAMAEMEALAQRDSVPIVAWETGRLLASLCRATDPRVLEVGTAIGYSALHMAQQLSEGSIVTLEYDNTRIASARELLDRAGVGDRVEIVEGDARETIPTLQAPFDLIFLDATKGEYRDYLRLAEPLASNRALLLIDNVLMSGEVALPHGTDTGWGDESLAAARALNAELLAGTDWLGSVLPVGDGVALATRRS